MSTFGDLERTFADLYPYRRVFAVGLMVLIVVSVAFAYKRGWRRYLWSHRVPVSIVAAPAMVAALWLGWSLGSPLFTNITVTEVSLRLLAQKVMLDETTVVASSGTWLQGGGDEHPLKAISILTNTS